MAKLTGKAKANARKNAAKAKAAKANARKKTCNATETTMTKTNNVLCSVTSANNRSVLAKLNDPTYGFVIQNQWKLGAATFTVFAPTLDDWDTDEELSNHLTVYAQAFGGVESQVFNVVEELEHKGSNNPYTGNKTYAPFQGGSYKLCIGVIDNPDIKDGMYKSPDGIPELSVSLIPLLQHGHEPVDYATFNTTYGDSKTLGNLHSMIARSNFSTIYTSGFNPNRIENLEHIFNSQLFMRLTPEVAVNWLNQYEVSYKMGRSCMYDDVQTIIGEDVANNVSALYSVFD